MPTPPDIISALEGNSDPDAQVLLQMAEIGADLTKPHEPEFAFEATTQASAIPLADQLSALGYNVEIYDPSDENPNYFVIAKCTMVLELNSLIQLSEQFDTLAEQYSVSYDGWGAEIVE